MSLTTITTICKEYKDVLIDAIEKFTKHSYFVKCQAQYLNDKKQFLHTEEALVLGDLAENYQFLIQDKIQSYHWSKEYCKLHPVVVYFKDDKAVLCTTPSVLYQMITGTIHGIGGSVKRHAAKRSLQRPMNNQILDYQTMLNVHKEEMSKITFFGISKETMDEVHK